MSVHEECRLVLESIRPALLAMDRLLKEDAKCRLSLTRTQRAKQYTKAVTGLVEWIHELDAEDDLTHFEQQVRNLQQTTVLLQYEILQ